MPATSPKYELIQDDRTPSFHPKVHRIRALRDIPLHGVHTGDLGGYVEGEHNLTHDGSAWIADAGTALGRSRVEGDALVKGHSYISGHAVVAGSAAVGSFTAVRGHSIVRGNASVMTSVVEDQVLIEGDVDIRDLLHLAGDAEYREQSQIPWLLRHADPTEPEYLDRVIEAAEIDPAFHRVLAAMGVGDDPEERMGAIQTLWADEADGGRETLAGIVKSIGGTFSPDAYKPRTASEMVSDTATSVGATLFEPEFTDFRLLESVRGDNKVEQEGGDIVYAGIVAVDTRHPETGEPARYFQPAIYKETPPSHPTLTPLTGRPLVSNEVYSNHIDASMRADEMLRDSVKSELGTTLTKHGFFGAESGRVDIDVSGLPLIIDSRVVPGSERSRPLYDYTKRLTVQTMQAASSQLATDLGGLTEPSKFAFVDIPSRAQAPISFKDIDQKVTFHSSPVAAYEDVTPIYANGADYLARTRAEISEREAQPLDDTSKLAPDRLDKPVLVMLFDRSDVPAPTQSEGYPDLSWAASEITPGGQHAYSQMGGQTVSFRADPSDGGHGDWRLTVEQRSGVEEHRGYSSSSDAKRAASNMNASMIAQIEATHAAMSFDGLKNTLKPMEWNNCPNPIKSAPANERWLDDAYEATSLNTRFTVEKSDGQWSLYVDSPDGDVFTQKPYYRRDGHESLTTAIEAADAYRISMIMDELSPPQPYLAPQAAVAEVSENHFAGVARVRAASGTVYKAANIKLKDVGYSIEYSSEQFDSKDQAADAAIKMLVDHREDKKPALTPTPNPAPSRTEATAGYGLSP